MKKIFEFKNFKITYFVFLLIIYLIGTNTYFNYEQSLIFGGADGFSYFEISKAFPKLSSIPLQPIHAERFFYPYLIGFFNKLFFVEIYTIYRILVIITLLFINYLLIKIFREIGLNSYNLLFSIILLNLNPYITRYYISNPLILNDLIFMMGSLYSILGIACKNKKTLFLGLLIASLARQSAIAIPISLLIILFFKKKKFFLNSKDIILSFIIFIFIYSLGYLYSGLIPQTEERYDQYYVTMFGIFLENVPFHKLILFFIWPFLSFAPLVIFLILYFRFTKKNFKSFYNLSFFLFFFSILIISQPILQGYEVSGKNIIRLSSIAFVPIMILFQINSKPILFKTNIKVFFYILMVFIWSCHPTFSVFNFLENYRF